MEICGAVEEALRDAEKRRDEVLGAVRQVVAGEER